MEARINMIGLEEISKVQPSFLSSASKSDARRLFRKDQFILTQVAIKKVGSQWIFFDGTSL